MYAINTSGNKKFAYQEGLAHSTHHGALNNSGDGKTYRVQSFIHSFIKSLPVSYLLTASSPFGSFLHSGHNHSPAGSLFRPTQLQWNH
jgi:hypothetical protein